MKVWKCPFYTGHSSVRVTVVLRGRFFIEHVALRVMIHLVELALIFKHFSDDV